MRRRSFAAVRRYAVHICPRGSRVGSVTPGLLSSAPRPDTAVYSFHGPTSALSLADLGRKTTRSRLPFSQLNPRHPDTLFPSSGEHHCTCPCERLQLSSTSIHGSCIFFRLFSPGHSRTFSARRAAHPISCLASGMSACANF